MRWASPEMRKMTRIIESYNSNQIESKATGQVSIRLEGTFPNSNAAYEAIGLYGVSRG